MAQIDKFAANFPFNARPIQPLDRRFLLASR
jgi:carbonic anhydrase